MANRRLKECERVDIKDFILLGLTNLKPSKGLFKEAREKFVVDKKTIYAIWKMIQEALNSGVSIDVKSKQKGNLIPKTPLDMDRFLRILKEDRHNIRQAALNYGVSASSIWRWIHEGALKCRKSWVHPALTEAHKIARIRWCLQALVINSEGVITYISMDQIVHIDEKWFYIQKLKDSYILLPLEEIPYDDCQSKHYVGKVMFMCCVGRPVYDITGQCVWDGKIGVWPFVEEVAARRSSINRPAGTIEVKAIASVTKEVMADMLINKIIPEIKSKWPQNMSKSILIQQDNATPHVSNTDDQFIQAAQSDGFNIKLINQPAKSPDCNILDLGFFNSIQSLQNKMQTKSTEDLICAVQMAYEGQDEDTIDNVFLDLQLVMTEILGARGHNNFKIPHIGKGKLKKMGVLPRNFTVHTQLVMDCIDYMKEMEEKIGNPSLLEGLGYDPE